MYIEGDIPNVVTSTCGGNSGLGYGNDSWIIIILFALIFGWGRNGYGFGGGNGSDGGVMNNYVLTSDFSQLSRQIDSGFASQERKLDGINNGLCSLGYQELQNITGVNQNISNGVYNLSNAITTGGYETRNAINGVSSQLASCCCDLRAGIADVKYENAKNTCAITNSMTLNTRDVIDNQNANFRALHDEIVANRIEDKNAQIQAQQNEINALRLAASQEKQNNYLVNQLKPCPIPAYITCNPYASNNCGCGCGTNVQ